MREEEREYAGCRERRTEGDETERDGRDGLPAQDGRVDLRAGQKREQDASEAGHEIDPRVRVQAEEISRQDADDDLDERRRQLEADGQRRTDGRQQHPEAGDRPHIPVVNEMHVKLLSQMCAGHPRLYMAVRRRWPGQARP